MIASYTYTGTTQTITVPAGAIGVEVRMAGAAGGGSQADATRSPGGLVEGVVDVTSGATLYINVGGKGGNAASGAAGAGGWPNGAAGGFVTASTTAVHGGGGGGGSDIRMGGTAVTNIIAAAGGAGGNGGRGTSAASAGGRGGGTNGDHGAGASADQGAGGTQIAGGGNAPNTSGVNGSRGAGGAGGGGGNPFGGAAGGGGGGGGYYGGEGGASVGTFGVAGGGGGGSGYVTTGTYTTGGNTTSDDGWIELIAWVYGPPLANCSTVTFAPGNTVGASHDQPAVYSTGSTLDMGFGVNRTPTLWPSTGALIKAAEVELTATSPDFTGDGQVQVGVFLPNDLLTLPGATSDASGVWSGWDGSVGGYRSGFADCYYLDKFGTWRTDYITFTSSGATAARLVSISSVTPGTGIDIRARVRSADWDHASARRICTTSTSLGLIHTSLRLDSSGVTATVLDAAGTATITDTAPWSAFSETDGQWLGIRFTLSGTTGTWYQDTSASPLLDSWTSVHTATFTSANTTPSTTINVGATNATTSGLDGDLSHWEIRDGSGTIIHQLALDRMDASSDTAWSVASNSVARDASGNTANGSTIASTKRVRIDLDTPCPVEDFRLIIDAQTGGLTVDEILLIAACRAGRRGLGLVR